MLNRYADKMGYDFTVKNPMGDSILQYTLTKKPKKNESLDEVAIIKNGRKYSNVKWFETEKGANDFLEKNPDFGVIQADKGGVYVANNKNKGTPVK